MAWRTGGRNWLPARLSDIVMRGPPSDVCAACGDADVEMKTRAYNGDFTIGAFRQMANIIIGKPVAGVNFRGERMGRYFVF
jgi:hypothetical protein